ncbi:MAG: protein kinase [Muribaculaceae bacterium]
MIPVDLLNYQLIRLLGRGGMGEVYLARNKNIEQYVAVKALHPKYANNPMVRKRFKQEAVMLNSLNHPNIVKFLNFVENEYGVFLIMEYVEGCTLEEFVTKRNGLVVEKKAYPMMSEILNAFSYAHERGIVHCDIKPSNIFITNDGHIKVMDFGIAQILSEVSGTQSGGLSMGTPAYMSPEQVYGQKLDQRSDIYSLGVLFHQMLTGRAPYDSTTMSELEIKGLVVNENLPRMKNYYPYISEGLQTVVDKATAKRQEDRYESCDQMFKEVKKILDPEKKSRMPIYMAAGVAAFCILVGLGIWDYCRTKIDYYKDYAEYWGVAKGIGSLSSREVSHREMSYRVESSKWKVRRITLVNSKGKPVNHRDTEHNIIRFCDTRYYYSDNSKIDYKKVYDAYGKLLYKIDYDENMKVAMFKNDDEHGTAKRLLLNTTNLYNVNDRERSTITRYLLSYNKDGLLEKVEYASGEDNTPVGDSDNVYGQAYSYDEKGRIIEVRFLGQDGKVRGNRIGLAIKQYAFDKDDNWTEVRYLSSTGNPSHDGNNCPLVKIGYDKWGNRTSENYLTIDGKPSYRTDFSVCGFTYEFDDDGNRVKTNTVDGKGKLMICKYGFATQQQSYNEDGFVIKEEYFDKEGKRVSMVNNDGSASSIVTYTVDDKGLSLSTAYYNTQEQPIEDANGVHKVVVEYDSVGNMKKADYLTKDLKPAHNSGFNCGTRWRYNDQMLCQTMSFYDENGNLTYDNSGVAICQFTYDKTGNVLKYEYLDKDGKTLVNSNNGFAVTEVAYDELGNVKTIRNYNSSLKPCMTSYGYFAKEYVYDEKTNFNTEEKFYNANSSLIKINRYTYDSNGNITSSWTVNGSGTLQGNVTHCEYDSNNRVVKMYYTNLSGRRVIGSDESYCEVNFKYDDRGNVIEQTYFDIAGKPAHDGQKAYKRIKRFDERNNVIYEKNLGKDGKPISGNGVNPEGKCVYDERGNMIEIVCLDGYGNPFTSSAGFYKLERTYNDNNLLVSELYRDTKGNLVTHKINNYAKVTYTYDSKRNRIKDMCFNAKGNVMYYITYTYNSQNSCIEACMYNSAGALDDSRIGFSKIKITYASDGVTPSKKSYHTRSGILAWQYYNTRTGEWGTLNF